MDPLNESDLKGKQAMIIERDQRKGSKSLTELILEASTAHA